MYILLIVIAMSASNTRALTSQQLNFESKKLCEAAIEQAKKDIDDSYGNRYVSGSCLKVK